MELYSNINFMKLPSTYHIQFFSSILIPDNFFGEGSRNLQQYPERVLPAKYVNGYTAEEPNEELYEKVKREAGYKGKTAQIPKEIEDD